VHKVTKRIEELQGAARKARLEAMQLAAKLLTTSNCRAGGFADQHAARRRARRVASPLEGLVKIADEAQAQIDRLQAEEHERKLLSLTRIPAAQACRGRLSHAALQRCGVLDDGRVVSVEPRRRQTSSCRASCDCGRLRGRARGAATIADPQDTAAGGDRNDRPFVQAPAKSRSMPRSRRRCPRAWCRAASTATGRTRHGEWHLRLEDLAAPHGNATPWPLPTLMKRRAGGMVQSAGAPSMAALWDDPRLGVSIGTRVDAETLAARRCRALPVHSSASPTNWAIACRASAAALRALLRRLARTAGARPDLSQRHPGAWRRPCLELLRTKDGSDDLRYFDWDTWRIGLASSDLAYMMRRTGTRAARRSNGRCSTTITRPWSATACRATTAPPWPRISPLGADAAPDADAAMTAASPLGCGGAISSASRPPSTISTAAPCSV
jgi:hypothetical protein